MLLSAAADQLCSKVSLSRCRFQTRRFPNVLYYGSLLLCGLSAYSVNSLQCIHCSAYRFALSRKKCVHVTILLRSSFCLKSIDGFGPITFGTTSVCTLLPNPSIQLPILYRFLDTDIPRWFPFCFYFCSYIWNNLPPVA